MTIREGNKFGLSGSVLKWIAMITMLIDHFGAIVIEGLYPHVTAMDFTDPVTIGYVICRMIGRLAFPIFAFLLAEGFFRTKNVKAYALRLGLFALISEIPFDYAFFGEIYWGYQNIFFTLLIGLLMLSLFHSTENWLLRIFYYLLACATAWLLKTDYDAFGVSIILLMDFFRRDSKRFVFPTAAALLYQMTAALAMIPIYYYNGLRGRQNKWFMYAFYPLHIIILWQIRGLLQ